jgi:hypothetical protein
MNCSLKILIYTNLLSHITQSLLTSLTQREDIILIFNYDTKILLFTLAIY